MRVSIKHIAVPFIALFCIFKGEFCQSQSDTSASNNRYALGISNSISFFLNPYVDGILLTPGICFKSNKHKFLAEVGKYFYPRSKNVYGSQIGYQYHFLKNNNKPHYYFETDLNYIRYLSGNSYILNIRFKPQNEAQELWAVWRNRLLIGTYGVGRNIPMLKVVDLNVFLGYSLIWKYTKYIDKNTISLNEGNSFHHYVLLKIGLGINLWKK